MCISEGKNICLVFGKFCVKIKWMIPQKNFIFPETDLDCNFCKFAFPGEKLDFKFNGWTVSVSIIYTLYRYETPKQC